MATDFLKMMENSGKRFSKGQKSIAKYINENYDKAAFMTAYKLGKVVGVSESTVVRFASDLGFDGFPEMRKSLQEMVRHRLTSVQRIEVAKDIMGNKEVLSSVMQADIEKIRTTLEELDRNEFDNAVNAIVNAKRIYILGIRSSKTLADFLGYYFHLLFDNVHAINSGSGSEILEQIVHISPDDVMIGITFPRYSKNTIKAMEYAKNKGATTISITDNSESPIANASFNLYAKSDMVSFIDSLVAPLSLVNALTVAVGMRSENLSETFESLENIWSENDVFETANK